MGLLTHGDTGRRCMHTVIRRGDACTGGHGEGLHGDREKGCMYAEILRVYACTWRHGEGMYAHGYMESDCLHTCGHGEGIHGHSNYNISQGQSNIILYFHIEATGGIFFMKKVRLRCDQIQYIRCKKVHVIY